MPLPFGLDDPLSSYGSRHLFKKVDCSQVWVVHLSHGGHLGGKVLPPAIHRPFCCAYTTSQQSRLSIESSHADGALPRRLQVYHRRPDLVAVPRPHFES